MKTTSAAVAAFILLAGCTAQAPPSSEGQASAASASASAAAAGPTLFDDVHRGDILPPGPYVMPYANIAGRSYPTLSFGFTVPDSGWQRVAIDGLLWNDNGARLGFAVTDNVFADPCDSGKGVVNPAVGPTVAELTEAVQQVPGQSVAADVEWDEYFGHAGTHVILVGTDASECDEAPLLRTPGFPGFVMAAGSDEQVDLWILSVQGTRVVVHTHRPVDASTDLDASLGAILQSIQITP